MAIKTPVIIVNFKTYEKATALKAEKLAKICDAVSKENIFEIVIAVQGPDIYRVKQKINIPVLAEHVDPIEYGSHTGHIIPEDIKLNGASGSLINHSEDRAGFIFIEKSIERLRELNLESIVCAQNLDVAMRVALMNPDFIAIEPPELIGGDVSVSTAQPELITEVIIEVKRISKDIKILCGAGIKNREDVQAAIKLGVDGILIASGITKVENPKKALEDLVLGFTEERPSKQKFKSSPKKPTRKQVKKVTVPKKPAKPAKSKKVGNIKPPKQSPNLKLPKLPK